MLIIQVTKLTLIHVIAATKCNLEVKIMIEIELPSLIEKSLKTIANDVNNALDLYLLAQLRTQYQLDLVAHIQRDLQCIPKFLDVIRTVGGPDHDIAID